MMNKNTPTSWDNSNAAQNKVAYVSADAEDQLVGELKQHFFVKHLVTFNAFEDYLSEQSILTLPDILLMEIDEEEYCFTLVEKIKKNPMLHGLLIVLLAKKPNKTWKARAMQLRVNDLYTYPLPVEHLSERLNFLIKFKLIRPKLSELLNQVDVEYKMPFSKRMFDIVSSSIALILASPIMIIVALVVKFGSKGPIIYKSKRVGTGYLVFDFYKFRSMRTDADKMMAQMSDLNQYAAEEQGSSKAAFVKIKNDPRVTKVGNFIRNTSLDELPQLFNILKGDMSLVGNRPLPLYEAEMLTSNEWSMRFLGPAGLTGLWQISKRGKEDMSERERKKLDNFYAQNYSFWLDLKILLGTFPALFQKEKV
ncbi:lipopolysaccharide/colanic/teichoic acid biosynthesis glycosyltransferase [Mucilaginibacter gracilis]|uniref:Lipopolysaccharide/colanic/teichoic acid biosynthesis glycosyltransferase n=1 Tax=Mucilaginibacter gracilis TaxID=423350 RepID=A0A495JAH9_9SPHI|nr:sugar transferase [Mucilaginibacter gracilis]RKR85478.1 lipopolysaccharide/colanic/teichoic acid biosynthesis glycosyltransferase [Mucilaginibacter gracilis]